MDDGATAVDGFVVVNDEFVFESDEHVGREDYPEGFFLNDGVTESAGGGVGRVAVGGVGDNVDLAAFAAECALAEAYGTVS